MVLPEDTLMGNLEMDKVYEYYDCPRLFSCKNEIGKNYIGLSVQDDDEWQMWIYVYVTPKRLGQIEKGDIELREAFTEAEESFVMGVTTYNDQPDTVDMILAKIIPDEMLPEKGMKLELNNG